MLNVTTIRNLANGELIRVLCDIRHHSPIIEELCRRLEEVTVFDDLNFPCPVCMAKLKVTEDEGEFKINIDR